jgi:hypothetical protein
MNKRVQREKKVGEIVKSQYEERYGIPLYKEEQRRSAAKERIVRRNMELEK